MKNIAQFFKVLADEARLKILWLLSNHRELCVCDIMATLHITQSKASRHLATLRHAGLVIDRKEGAWSYYSIRPAENDLHQSVLDTLRARLTDHAGAAQVLDKLHEWLEHKGLDSKCIENRPYQTVTETRGAARSLNPLEEGTR